MNIQKYSKTIFIGSQIYAEDVSRLRDEYHVRVVVNNRVDEEERGQPLHQDLERTCRTHGIDYYYLPMQNRNDIDDERKQARDFILQKHAGEPILFFCRSGARSEALLSA